MKYQYRFLHVFAVLLGLYGFLYIGVIFDYDGSAVETIPILKKYPSFRLKYASVSDKKQYESQHALSPVHHEKLTPTEEREEADYNRVVGKNNYYLTYWQFVVVQAAISLVAGGLLNLLRRPRKISILRYALFFSFGLTIQVILLVINWELLNVPLLFYSALIIINILFLLLFTKRAGIICPTWTTSTTPS